MDISVEKSYRLTIDVTQEELSNVVQSIEEAYSNFIKTNKDTDSIAPLLTFKDILVTSIHNSNG